MTVRVLSIMNHKGGCGKTTTAINLSACLALRGWRTLLVDLDPEQHATIGLGIAPGASEGKGLSAVLSGAMELGEITIPVRQSLALVPSDEGVRKVDGEGSSVEALALALSSARERFDFAVIDCPPASGWLARSALVAADEVIIAVETSFFALHGVKRLLDLIEESRRATGKPGHVRALATMYDRRTTFAREVLSEIRRYFGDALYDTVIAYTVRLKEAASHGLSIVDYDRSGRGCRDYLGLAEEVLCSAPAADRIEQHGAERRSTYG